MVDKHGNKQKEFLRDNLAKLQSIIIITKRLVLSAISSWYDRLGLLSPISTSTSTRSSSLR
jgi:hypothetical protein